MTTAIGAPCNIELLLWCHTRAEPHPRADAPANSEALQRFIGMGAVEPQPDEFGVFRTTALGKAWVEALCRVEPPRQVFVDHAGRILP